MSIRHDRERLDGTGEKVSTEIAKIRAAMFTYVVINVVGISGIVAIVCIAFKVIPA